MTKKDERRDKKTNAKLSGMGVYGTTSNTEIAGYKASGDIENAGRLDKGFQKNEDDDLTPEASLKEDTDADE